MSLDQLTRPTPLQRLGRLLVLASIPLFGIGCGKSPFAARGAGEAKEGDDPPMVSVTLTAEKLELFMEHPYLVQGQDAKFNVHLTLLQDGSPIRSGKLTVVATGPSGKQLSVEQTTPRSPGIYGPTVAFPEAGENEMALTLQSEQAEETIRVPVTVFPNEAATKKAAEEMGGEEPQGTVKFLKEQGWKIGIVHESVAKRRLVERLVVPGQIVPSAGAKAVVTPPIAGRVLPPPQGSFPRVGQQVKAGDVVAVIEPPLAGPEGVELMVNRAQIHALETELAVKQLDVEVEIKKAEIDLEHARHVHQRAKSLSSQGATAVKQLQEAEHELKLAEAGYEGKLGLRQPYEQARKELQAMLSGPGPGRNRGNSSDSDSIASSRTLQLTLRGPVSGTVTTAQVTEGEFVDATKALFTIINMDRVWIEAKVSEYDLERVATAPAATFTLAAYPDRTFTILGRDGGQLIDIGSVVDPNSRTVPVRYEVQNPERVLRIGMFADVAIETERAEEMLAIPDSAIVDEDGRPTAYVLLDGESFQKRDLELGIRDSGYVQVKVGLKEGERVVTKGAYAIRLASVSSVIPAHGHAH
ncbi:MAG: efflux RND transporter periplasmic adaptor subunit [Planctomycetes bacterium]|nr:efflux RND transporter periplasmic adaptor subunit [Planctomycetota bacterium]